MDAEETLLRIRDVIEKYGDERVKNSFFLEFHRRLLVLRLIEENCQKGSLIIDLGAQPFIISCALKLMGYRVIAYDYEPEQYLSVAKAFNVEVCKCDLERDSLGLEDESVDCAVLSEVIEHLNPYYINHTLAEINRALKVGGKLVITTPNIASLFRRIRLLLGRQPQYRLHVHEYTKEEVETLLLASGFSTLKSFYSNICDLTYINTAKEEDYLKIRNFVELLKLALRKPAKTNIIRALAYPVVKLFPSLRMTTVILAVKEKIMEYEKTSERW